MIGFPPCKINLGLHITGKRPDGYHNLETVFYPLPFCDMLELLPLGSEKANSWKQTGLPIPGEASENICIRAWQLLKKDFPGLPFIYLHLHKIIPMGAGLGGGSADGAFALLMMNEMARLQLSRDQLLQYALQLGSDCPFFIINQPCFASGRGEILEPIPLQLKGYTWVLVNPGIHVSTAAAFSGIRPAPAPVNLKEGLLQDPRLWKGWLKNDFEDPVFEKYPLIRAIRQQLYDTGAVYASMSGSGSTVYGLFEAGHLPDLRFPASYLLRFLPE